MNVKNKVVWLTGASSGIGESLAYELAKRGAKLILSARREEVLNKVKQKCLELNSSLNDDDIKVLTLDLEQTQELNDKASQAIKLFGAVDILINNGGISQRSLAFETSVEVDERLMKINYIGTVALTKAVLPTMVKAKRGQIVTVSSMVGKFGTPYRSGYAASKHAIHGFMDSLRAELHDNGIIVTIVCPGFVATNVSLNALSGDGSASGEMDKQTEAGIKPTDFAVAMANAIEANKAEVYIAGAKEKLGLFMKRFFPNTLNKMVRKMNVR